MSGTEFEAYVCGVLRSNGYLVALTRVTGDFGVDLVARRGTATTAVQCKRHGSPVGPNAVREVVAGAVVHDCTSTMVVTNQTFTSGAVALAKLHNCVLVDGSELAKLAGIWWPDAECEAAAIRSTPKGGGARLGNWSREELSMFERFTQSARTAVVLAREEAGDLSAPEIGPEHLLVGAVQSAGHVLSATLGGYGLTADAIRAQLVAGDGDEEFEGDVEALRSIGIDLHAIRDGIASTFGRDAWDDALRKSGRRRRRRGHIPFTRSAKKVLELALREALAHEDGSIGCEHVVLGILRGGDKFTLAIITEHVTASQLRESIVELLDKAA